MILCQTSSEARLRQKTMKDEEGKYSKVKQEEHRSNFLKKWEKKILPITKVAYEDFEDYSARLKREKYERGRSNKL